jgi:hypothetical protein
VETTKAIDYFMPEHPGVEAGVHLGGWGLGPLLSAKTGAAIERASTIAQTRARSFDLMIFSFHVGIYSR